ncbi:MAG: hypothetical protein M3I19_02475 [Lancefieldella parvula]|uniref:Uncharacterized protein n=1 Tax=Lancefieldella parvula TaxID=1382 RepID=A0A9E7ADI0_9ACTN|nr:MAG: hypothetical protein M3I19_02475 [Lancefieldella parvula]
MSYKHFDADKTRLASPAQPTDEATDEKPGLLKDVSITQILATSLAAVTAFVLSNQIGIAGSIIGVAVGAAASALASQIYQNVIRRSTHKFRAGDNDEYNQQAYPNSSQTTLEGTQYMPRAQYAPSRDYYPNADSRTGQSSQVNRTPTAVSQARKSADYRDHYFNYLYHFCRHSLCHVPQLYHRRIWLGTKGQHNPSCDGKNYEYQQFDG